MGKGRSPGWERNNHWVLCDVCGFATRVKDIKMSWDGLAVCPKDWEPRHPQDFVRGKEDNTAPVGPSRPDQEGTTVSVGYPDMTGNPDYEVPSGTF